MVGPSISLRQRVLTSPLGITGIKMCIRTKRYLGNLGSDIGLAILPKQGVVGAELQQVKHPFSAFQGSCAIEMVNTSLLSC